MSRIGWKVLGCALPALIIEFTFDTAHPYILLGGLLTAILSANAFGYIEGYIERGNKE